MTSDAFLNRLRNHEDNFVERKPAGVNAAEIRQTLVAFANSVTQGREAILFIGVHNDGRIQGVESPDKLQKTVREQCERVCYPPISFSTTVLRVEDRDVLAVIVPESKNRPHFSGAAFIRRGSESVAASPELFEELVASRNSKASAILATRPGVISVVCVQHRLGSTEYVADTRARTMSECRVTSCTGHFVRMYDISTGRNVSEPLDLIDLSYDEERYRPMLVIRGRGRAS
jgi:hypothetical protein